MCFIGNCISGAYRLSFLILIRVKYNLEDKPVQRPNQLCFEMFSFPHPLLKAELMVQVVRNQKMKEKDLGSSQVHFYAFIKIRHTPRVRAHTKPPQHLSS